MEGFEVPDPHETLEPDLPPGSRQERVAHLCRHLARHVAVGGYSVIYAGDCLASIGVLAGLQQRDIDPSLIWFDAHGDFHTWETTRSMFLGGMPLAMIVGRGEQTIVQSAGLRPLREDRVILVDARDLDPGEREAVADSEMRVASVHDVTHSLPPDGPLYLHVDVDVVDPSEMPAVNFPAPAGPSLAQVKGSLLHLASTGRVVATSISSWNPALPGAAEAARATSTLTGLFMA